MFIVNSGDQSIIVELLEMNEDYTVEHYFVELAHDNEAVNSEITDAVEMQTELGIAHIISGKQMIPKWGKPDEMTEVSLLMALVRLKRADTDLLISFNQSNDQALFKEMIGSVRVNDWTLFIRNQQLD